MTSSAWRCLGCGHIETNGRQDQCGNCGAREVERYTPPDLEHLLMPAPEPEPLAEPDPPAVAARRFPVRHNECERCGTPVNTDEEGVFCERCQRALDLD